MTTASLEHDPLITEDDKSQAHLFSEKQQCLLANSLYHSWKGPGQGRSFVALANVDLFDAPKKLPLIPDVLVSLDINMPDDVLRKSSHAYRIWEYGKPPEVVIQIVSTPEGKKYDTKLPDYAKIGVRYCVVFDPDKQLKRGLLRVYELRGTTYAEKNDRWLFGVELGITLWEGKYENNHNVWLRWCDRQGKLISTGTETTEEHRLEKEKAQKKAEHERLEKEKALEWAEQEHQRAEQEHQRAERLAAQLRALGIEPQ